MDPVMECPKCRGTADKFAGSDKGVHYLCPACGCSFVFDVRSLKTEVERDAPDPGTVEEESHG